MAKKNKLTQAERALDDKMLAILDWATRHPTRWHSISPEKDWNLAAQLLAERGVIEIRRPQNQYKLKPATGEADGTTARGSRQRGRVKGR